MWGVAACVIWPGIGTVNACVYIYIYAYISVHTYIGV